MIRWELSEEAPGEDVRATVARWLDEAADELARMAAYVVYLGVTYDRHAVVFAGARSLMGPVPASLGVGLDGGRARMYLARIDGLAVALTQRGADAVAERLRTPLPGGIYLVYMFDGGDVIVQEAILAPRVSASGMN